MKSIFLSTAAIVFLINTSSAQKLKETEVPKSVVDAFYSNFKDAKAKEWEKEAPNYEAEFNWNKVETSATFSADGKLMETEHEIKVTELPKAIAEYITKNYAGYKISEASKIEDVTDKTTKFEAEIQKGKEEMDLMFDADGKFLSKEAQHDDKDEKK